MKTDSTTEKTATPRWYRVTLGLILFAFALAVAGLPVGDYPFHHFCTETCGMSSGGWEEFLCIGTFALINALVVAAAFWLVWLFYLKKRMQARPVEHPVRSLVGCMVSLWVVWLAITFCFPPNSDRYSRAVEDNWTFSARIYRLLSAEEIDDPSVFRRVMSSGSSSVEGAFMLLDHGVPAADNPQPFHILLPDGRMGDIPAADSTRIFETLRNDHRFTPCFEGRLRVLEALLKRGDDPNLRVRFFRGDSLSLPLDAILDNLYTTSSAYTDEECADFCLRATELLLAHGADFTAWAPSLTTGKTVDSLDNTPAARWARGACQSERIAPFFHKLLLRHPELKGPILSSLNAGLRSELEELLRQMENAGAGM